MSASLRCAFSTLAVCAFLSMPAKAADPAAGREKAGQCATCHGKDGIATTPDAPNLAGMSSIYTEAQLKAFKAGERQHQQMSIIAQSLSEEDIADLAAWYAAIEVTATLPAE
ncbi:Class I diheme cytochrome c4 [Fulvimarina pelagi HTCC2506]|uniref:Class I diheme cytochrome c4 n=2 Tax=Fulvimarina pelagi TaxID=217511 RepID=Q0G1G1_9HYPH|nr:cytochrome c [Fulvimarina pelagi]EAU41120.1 Class I diheme cytochrome c4 [Fulvimarina pelagi HTCC2506]BAT30866.1 class I diheme cytochrome c4 [Fulvimarina pelagi]